MMPPPYSVDLWWRVIWFVHILQNSVVEASFFLRVCERRVERYISKFLVNGHVKPGLVGRSYGSTRRAHCFCIPNMETTVPFGRATSIRQPPFAVLSDNVFEMGVYREWNIYRGVITQVVKTLNFEIPRCLLADYVVEKYFKKMVWTLDSAEDGFRTGCRSVSH